ncbi:hypothetical protein COBT_001509, partial [Conglomerata obtusa]
MTQKIIKKLFPIQDLSILNVEIRIYTDSNDVELNLILNALLEYSRFSENDDLKEPRLNSEIHRKIFLCLQIIYTYLIKWCNQLEVINDILDTFKNIEYFNFEKLNRIIILQILERISKLQINGTSHNILVICEKLSTYKNTKYQIHKMIKYMRQNDLIDYICKYENFRVILANQNQLIGSESKELIENNLLKINTHVLATEIINLLSKSDFSKNGKIFPLTYTKIGYRNLTRIFNVLNQEQRLSLKNNCNALIYFLLDDQFVLEYTRHYCEYIRIKNFARLQTDKDIYEFLYYNQFFDDVGLRKEYYKIFNNKLVTIKNFKTHYIKELKLLTFKMCKSDVKIRREIGINCLNILLDSKVIIMGQDILDLINKLVFDPYEEIRNVAIKYIDFNALDTHILINNLESFEYSKIYSSVKFLAKKKCIQNIIILKFNNVFEYYVANDIENIIKHPIYGYVVFINETNIKCDAQSHFLFYFCFKHLKSMYSNIKNEIINVSEQDTNMNKLFETVLWRLMKELSVYYCSKATGVEDLHKLEEIMFSINHLGLYSHVYELLKQKFNTFSCNLDDITKFVSSVLDKIENYDFELSRKGAGISLYCAAFLNMKNYTDCLFKFYINNISERLDRCTKKDTIVIYINILIKIINCTKSKENIDFCVVQITNLSFKLAVSREWEIKNVAIILFAKIVSKIFGKHSWDRKIKKDYDNNQFRIIILELLKKTCSKDIKFMVLLVYDRLNTLSEQELI